MAILTWLRQIQHALQEGAESIRRTEESKRKLKMPSDDPVEVRAVVSFDQKTITDTTTQNNRTNATQDSIKKATWAAFGAVAIYAVVTTFMWCAMIEQNKIAAKALRQSLESFRIDERASIEIESMKLKFAVSFPPTTAVGYEVIAKNFGKTAARDIVLTRVTAKDANTDETIKRRMIQNALKGIPPMENFPKSLGPSVPIVIPFNLGGSAPQTFGNVQKQVIWRDYLIGRIDYSDSFGIPHWVTFCFVIIDTRGNINYCEYGNDEDRNPELPPN